MEKIQPTREWLAKYEEVKHFLVSPINYATCFEMNEIQGKEVVVLDMGEVSFPSGEILVRDPLVWLRKDEKPYLQSVSVGRYKLETLVIKIEEEHDRYMATRVKFTDKKPIIYQEALRGDEDLSSVQEGSFFGFEVDAGLATIVDVQTKNVYCDFENRWYQEHPDKNIYDDFFAEVFRQNVLKYPLYQREGGDWINFEIPGTELSIPMIQSGFGDGVYPVYFGYDKNGHLCDVVMEYIFVG